MGRLFGYGVGGAFRVMEGMSTHDSFLGVILCMVSSG